MLFTFPSRYCFTIGRQGVFSLGRWSCRIHTGFHVPRTTRDPLRRARIFGYRAVTSYGEPFQTSSPNPRFFDSMWNVPQPRVDYSTQFGLIRVRSPLLTESLLFSLPPGTEMFQFPGYASNTPMDSACGTRHRYRVGSPIRTSPDRSLLTAPRGVSSFATSFVGSWRLGIHRVP